MHVELLEWGTVNKVSELIAKPQGIIIARRVNWHLVMEKGLQAAMKEYEDNGKEPPKFAGRQRGKRYDIWCKPHMYVKGDMKHWRAYDWAGLVDRKFPGRTNDFSIIVLALEPDDPVTWEPAAEEVSLEREAYELAARVDQVTNKLRDYTQVDDVTKSFGGQGQG